MGLFDPHFVSLSATPQRTVLHLDVSKMLEDLPASRTARPRVVGDAVEVYEFWQVPVSAYFALLAMADRLSDHFVVRPDMYVHWEDGVSPGIDDDVPRLVTWGGKHVWIGKAPSEVEICEARGLVHTFAG